MAHLTKPQYATVRDGLQPATGYLYRLRERLNQVGFLPEDKLYQLASKAFDALQSLTMELHYLSCSSGVGIPSEKEPE